MKRTPKHVGLDVHQATTVVSVRDGHRRVIHRDVIPTTAAAVVSFVQGLRGPIYVALEEGTQAQWLHDLLRPHVDDVIVCDRRGESRRGNKADQLDADGLSARLCDGTLRAVYHSRTAPARQLKELAQTYLQVVDDTRRVMQRLKALFRARAIATPGRRVYRPDERAQWLAKLTESAARFRATVLYAELDVLRTLHRQAQSALVSAAQTEAAWSVLRTIPFFGPIRVALLLATLQTPWRFRTKRHLWAYAGLAVVTRTTAEYQLEGGRAVRRRRLVMTRGLNRNHNPIVKDVLKGAATAATTRPGALRELYERMLMQGTRPELARVTLARKLAAMTLHLWKTGETYEPTKLTLQAR